MNITFNKHLRLSEFERFALRDRPLFDWSEAIHRSRASQMRHVRALMEALSLARAGPVDCCRCLGNLRLMYPPLAATETCLWTALRAGGSRQIW